MVVAGDHPSLEGVRRLLIVGRGATTGTNPLVVSASRLGIPTEPVPVAPMHDLTARLVGLVGDGRDAVLVLLSEEDAAPVEISARQATAAAARRTGADLWEQQGRLDDATFVVTASEDCADDVLDRLHHDHSDPWGVETRWFEQRKRDLVLAMLPRTWFARTLELGCSTGALAQALLTRSDEVVAVDRSESALEAARARFVDEQHVQVSGLDIPWDWPDGSFDLVVVSEVGYFLSPAALDVLVQKIGATLTQGGVLVLSHWRHPIEDWVLDGADVHHRFRVSRLPPVAATYRDRDVEIQVHAEAKTWADPEH